jgi:flavorubredoxin
MDLHVNDRSNVMNEAANSGLIALGAPTMNNQVFPAMADILCYLKGLKPKNKLGFAFGSYGWSGEGGKQIKAVLDEMGVEQPCEMFQVKYMPTAEDLKKIHEIGEKLGQTLLAKIKK